MALRNHEAESTSDASLSDRIERLESLEAIRDLVNRYAIAADVRDVDAVLEMFVPDVDCGSFGRGRDALRRFYAVIWCRFYRSLHKVTAQTATLTDSDHATGTVFMRAEHEVGERWVVVAMALFDDYERRARRWHFVRRRIEFLYGCDQLDRPQAVAFDDARALTDRAPTLPGSKESWVSFWKGHEAEVHQSTAMPSP
jgi:hypothetical protein